MRYTRVLVCVAAFALVVAAAVPCRAWLFDPNQRLASGPKLQAGTSTVWAASSFWITSDAYATQFGVALMRMSGPVGAGYDVSLVETYQGVPDLSRTLWTGTLVPTGATPTYYYADAAPPVFMRAYTVYSLVFRPNATDLVGGPSWMQYAGHSGWGTSDGGQTWNSLIYPMCVRVDGYVVPEPGALGVLLCGLCGLITRGRMRPRISR